MANAGFVAVPARYNPTQTFVPEGRNQSGPIEQRFGAPQVGLSPEVDTYFGGHFPYSGGQFAEAGGTLVWSRPYFPNTAGREWDQPVSTFQPGLNSIATAGPPASLPPAMAKRYDQGTLRHQFGAWAQNFYPSGSGDWVQPVPMPGQRWRAEYYPTGEPVQLAAAPRLRPQPSSYVRLNFFAVQPQIGPPSYNLLTNTAQAGSYGQWTDVLPAVPAGMEAVYGG